MDLKLIECITHSRISKLSNRSLRVYKTGDFFFMNRILP